VRTVLSPFILFFPFFLMGFLSCGTAQEVLGLSPGEAAELLRDGDTGFIFRSDLPTGFSQAISRLTQLNQVHPAASFYAALRVSSGNNPEESSHSAKQMGILLFCAALESPLLPARREAALKLIPLILNGDGAEAGDLLGFLNTGILKEKNDRFTLCIRAACLYRLGRYDEVIKLLSAEKLSDSDGWENALFLFASYRTEPAAFRAEIPAFLFEVPAGEIRQWAYAEALYLSENPQSGNPAASLLDPWEYAAVSNRISQASQVNYRAALNNLRPALDNGGSIFFRYPELISDLGRAYLYTPALRDEGMRLFASWDTSPETDSGEKNRERRYLILYYLGRMERAREQYAKSTEYFSRALEFAPDALQSDTCIWYMLMNTFAKDPAAAVPLALDTMAKWNDVSYFDDILDRLASYLTDARQWKVLEEIFSGLERGAHGAVGVSLAQYAWILGRAVQDNHLKTDRSADDFFRIAFEKGNWSFYYRAMAASKLGETFVPEGGFSLPAKANDDELKFILGFFECGASSFALPWIRAIEEDLHVTELRKIAGALAASEMLYESLNLISRYTRREDYGVSREDLYLF
jgi:soluble lytic murein transglycosylase